MSVVSEKGMSAGLLVPFHVRLSALLDVTLVCFPVRNVEEIERPLAQSLEAWVLQQAVSGLMLEGQLEQAEALCTQVENEHTHSLASHTHTHPQDYLRNTVTSLPLPGAECFPRTPGSDAVSETSAVSAPPYT